MEEMPEVKRCPICGAQIGSSDGLCPPCVMKLAARHDAPPQPAGSPGLDRLLAQTLPPLGVKFHYFGDYELIEEIARGGMGVVFRARQISLNRIVAVKLIREGRLATPEAVRRFHVEAEAAAALDHPNIVPIHEIAEHEGHHYFSMKLVEGGNLAQRLAASTEPLPVREAAALVAKIARAVHYAHQRGILHRDLKPANILIDQHGEPHITDFGLAKVLQADEGQTASGALLGTPAYMSPEQAAANNGQLTTASDIFSLGVVLYELITGQPPFPSATLMETLKLLVEAEPKPPRSLRREIDRDLETVCLKCLNKNPAQRFSSAAELADELERWLAGETIQARPTNHAEKLWRFCRRRPSVAILSALTLILATVGISGWVIATKRALNETRERNNALRILNASDLFLADRALAETNLENAATILTGLKQVINRRPNDPFFWKARAVMLEKANALDEACEHYLKTIDLFTKDNSAPNLLNEVLLKRSSLLRRLNREVEAGCDYRRAIHLPIPLNTQNSSPSVFPDFREAWDVSAELGYTNHESGLYLLSADDSLHSPAVNAAQECRLFKPKHRNGLHYAYFGIEPTFKWRCSPDVTVAVEYTGCDEGEFGIHFDGTSGPFTPSQRIVRFWKSEKWRVAEFNLTNVVFDARQNSGADFRLWAKSCGLYVRRISVFRNNYFRERHLVSGIPQRDPSAEPNLIDLTAFYDGPLWRNFQDRGFGNDLASLPYGIQSFGGVIFDVRGVIQLCSGESEQSRRLQLRSRVSRIPVGLQFTKLQALLGTASTEALGKEIGSFILHYSDGELRTLPIRYGEHTLNWLTETNADASRAIPVWTTENEYTYRTPQYSRVYTAAWDNPRPNVQVDSLDFASAMTACAPFLIAITGENADSLELLARRAEEQCRWNEAENLYREAIKVRGPNIAGDYLVIAQLHARLAAIFRRIGRIDQAEALLRQILAQPNLAAPAEQRARWIIKCELGNVLRDQGKFAQAESVHSEVLAERRTLLPLDAEHYLQALSGLAQTYLEYGKFHEAEMLVREALQLQESILGKNNHSFATLQYVLGMAILRQGRADAALPILTSAVEVLLTIFGPDHPDVGIALAGLSKAHDETLNCEDADRASAEALRIHEKNWKHSHRDLASSLHGRANMLMGLHRTNEAKAMVRRSLEMRRQLYLASHPATAESLNGLGVVLYRQGQRREGAELAEAALAIRRNTLSHNHPDIGESLLNLAVAYRDAAEFGKAEIFARECLAIHQSAYVIPNARVARAIDMLMSILVLTDRIDEAEQICRHHQAILQAFDSAHDAIAEHIHARCKELTQIGRHAEAELLATKRGLLWAGLFDAEVAEIGVEKAIAFLEKTIEERRSDVKADSFQYARASLLARAGRWQAAADAYSAFLDGPIKYAPSFGLGPLYVALGDTNNYERFQRRVAAHTLKWFGPLTASEGAVMLLLSPASSRAVTAHLLAERAVLEGAEHAAVAYFHFAKGFAEYRRFRWEEATASLNKSLDASQNEMTRIQALTVSSMAAYKLKRLDLAKDTLAKARAAFDTVTARSKNDFGPYWARWLVAKLLLTEAESLIGKR